MKNKIFIKNPLYLIILGIIIGIILVSLLYSTDKLQEEIEDKMIEISTVDIFSISQNSAKSIQSLLKQSLNYSEDIKNDIQLQSEIEKKLKILITENIKYAYLLYKDNQGVFRFLADASPPEEKANLNQKFDIANSKWLEIYDKKSPLVIKQKFIHELSLSYITPILYKNNVSLILAIDFSVQKVQNINRIIDLIKKGIFSIIIIIIFFLVVLFIQTIRYLIMQKTAYIDNLTNVYNRNYLQELKDFINLDDYILAALDIDHFKKVNDTYGHDVGDKVLKQFSNIFQDSIRHKDDIIIRYGGEEFIILAKVKKADNISAINVIERLFTNIQENKFYISEKESINMTASIGVNLTPHKSRTFSEAFKLADTALYNAKNNGRNSIEIYDENETNKNNSKMSINEIKLAIEDDRVICYFQKIIDTNSKKISHYEALLRIIDKKGNIILPDKILPVIKGTFILRNITKKILDICYAELLKDEKIHINININPQDLINESIITILKNYSKINNISNRLGLEIVESEDMINYKKAKNNLLMLKNLGYKIFIDDFGSGYSNFIYLTEIQTDYIKIDGNIIKKIAEDEVSFLVVKNIVNFAKEANIKVIAEYVCDEKIYKKIQSLNIEYSQGYLFSIPSPLNN